MKARIYLASICLLLVSTMAMAKQIWLTDSISNCKVWSDETKVWPDEIWTAIRWDGPCKDGHAEGQGVLHVFTDNKGRYRYEGRMLQGRLNGTVNAIRNDGKYFVTTFRDGRDVGSYSSKQQSTGPIEETEHRDGRLVKSTTTYLDKPSVREYRYDGNKLVKLTDTWDGKTSVTDFRYDGNKLVKSTTTAQDGKTSVTDYRYDGNKLVKLTTTYQDGNTSVNEKEYRDGSILRTSLISRDKAGKETFRSEVQYEDGRPKKDTGFLPTEYTYQDGKLSKVVISHSSGPAVYYYADGKLVRKVETIKSILFYHITETEYKDGETVRTTSREEINSPKALAQREEKEGSVAAEESTEDSGIGSFLGGLLGAVSQYQQARGNTVKASQAEVLSAALSGDEKRAEAATSKLQSLAEAERARKAKEQADKVAAQEAAQLRAMQATAARNSASSSSSYGGYSSADSAGGSDPSQNYPTQQQPTYPSGNTSSSGKRPSEAPRPVIDVRVISYGSKTSYGKLKYFVRARNVGNVNVSCYVTINWGYSSAIYGDKYDSTAGHLRLQPGQTDEFVIEGENAHYRSWFEKYSLRDCRQS